MKIEKLTSAQKILPSWDKQAHSIYQKTEFLLHLEKYNPCNQRYYIYYDDSDNVIAGAVVYSLIINLFTFSKSSFTISFSVIGLPASVDASGIVGENENHVNYLISKILKQEKGLILSLNYNKIDHLKSVVKMQTLPTLIFEKRDNAWNDFLYNIKHNYRRRILKAEEKIADIEKHTESCSRFTEIHYNQYLAIMERTNTKLEILSFDFFQNLPDNYKLISLYHKNELLVWHISVLDADTYYFLFGGINYKLRDKFDSYYNNLISIIKEGFDIPCKTINLGQTALVSKNRLGAKVVPLRLFIYHSNPIIRLFLNLGKKIISYKIEDKEVTIYKN
ncbi:hypothetical protein LJC53_03315 [Bacteroidales bacterium OttesenSCG-928-C03]|nr:hypothetical protein [Bacteroidales bacterium OttesenSCG-928-C03]MDL2325888.1 hypothetical protein [Bacteroidales bacterium OttesenSCG-928-A14]